MKLSSYFYREISKDVLDRDLFMYDGVKIVKLTSKSLSIEAFASVNFDSNYARNGRDLFLLDSIIWIMSRVGLTDLSDFSGISFILLNKCYYVIFQKTEYFHVSEFTCETWFHGFDNTTGIENMKKFRVVLSVDNA